MLYHTPSEWQSGCQQYHSEEDPIGKRERKDKVLKSVDVTHSSSAFRIIFFLLSSQKP